MKIYVQQWNRINDGSVFGTTLHQTEAQAQALVDRVSPSSNLIPEGARIEKDVREDFYGEVGSYANLLIPGRTPDQVTYNMDWLPPNERV